MTTYYNGAYGDYKLILGGENDGWYQAPDAYGNKQETDGTGCGSIDYSGYAVMAAAGATGYNSTYTDALFARGVASSSGNRTGAFASGGANGTAGVLGGGGGDCDFLFDMANDPYEQTNLLASSSGYSSVAVTLAYRLTELASGMGGDMEDDGDEDGAMELYLDKYSFWGPYMSWFWNCYPYCN